MGQTDERKFNQTYNHDLAVELLLEKRGVTEKGDADFEIRG